MVPQIGNPVIAARNVNTPNVSPVVNGVGEEEGVGMDVVWVATPWTSGEDVGINVVNGVFVGVALGVVVEFGFVVGAMVATGFMVGLGV